MTDNLEPKSKSKNTREWILAVVSILSLLGNFYLIKVGNSNAIDLNENFLPAIINRSLVYRDLNRFSEALIDCNKAIKLAPREASTYNNRGWVYYGMGRYDEAIKDYSKALSLDPEHIKSIRFRGASLAELGAFDDAKKDYLKLLEIDPDKAAAYNSIAWFLIDNEIDPKEGLEYAKKSIEINPYNSNTQDTLGWGFFKLGKYKEAEKVLLIAIKMDPDSDEIKSHLCEVRKKLRKNC